MRRVFAILSAIALAAATASCGTPASTASAAAAGDAISADERAIAGYAKQIRSAAEKDFTLVDLNGKTWTLSALKGKIVLLNFWATWCGPCQREMPDFQKVYERFGEDGDVVVLAVASAALEGGSGDAAKNSIETLADKQGYTFPILFDADGSVWGMYEQQGVPSNYIVDAQGNVRLLKLGAFSGEDDVYAALEAVRRADSGQ